MRAMLGEEVQEPIFQDYSPVGDVPENFDARERWPGLIYEVLDQASCGSCWAFAASESMSNRLAIKGCPRGIMSPQDLVSCDKNDHGCNGGSGPTSFGWIASNGVTNQSCLAYTSGGGRVPACPSTCDDGSQIIRSKVVSAQTFTMSNIQNELMTNGPVYFRFTVYSDFMSYKSGIYQHKTGYQQGGHAVLLIGWGVENDVPYWILQNSWGKAWGEQGHFRMIRGKNDCACENGFYSGAVIC